MSILIESNLPSLATRIYAEHAEIMLKMHKYRKDLDPDLCHEIAIHHKIIYDISIEMARAVLNQCEEKNYDNSNLLKSINK